jgi:flagellar motility protein MotE (MotC chaperone)
MKPFPRILPLVVIAAGGALALRLIAGVASLPDIAAGAKAWAEDIAPGAKATASANMSTPDAARSARAANGPAPAAPAGDIMAVNTAPAPQVCAPTPEELAKQAGLSPAELQTLQNLGARRTQLDQRERDMSTQLALLSAAETKIDAKLQQLAGLKTDIQGLLGQADAEKAAEVDRLVNVFQAMKPKDAAARFGLLDDSVRLPVAAKMKDKAFSAILAQMTPTDAKVLTERLAARMAPADQARDALASNAPSPAPAGAAPSSNAGGAAKPGQSASAAPAPPTNGKG